jgi:hypothetical protein
MTPRRLARLAIPALVVVAASFSLRALAAPADEPEGVKNDKPEKKELIRDLPGVANKVLGPAVPTTRPRPARPPSPPPPAAG